MIWTRRGFVKSLSTAALVLSFEDVLKLSLHAQSAQATPQIGARPAYDAQPRAAKRLPSPVVGTPLGYNFIDVATQSGLNKKTIYGDEHRNRFLLETTGCGVAFYDFDHDDWLDIFMVNGTRLDGFPKGDEPISRLFKNNRDGTFTDITAKTGMTRSGWGQGCCVGDYDNDGLDDLFVSYYGQPILYRNHGDGTFTDVTAKAGLSAPGWSTSAVWFDYDNDGRLDLFVCQFVKIENGLICTVDEDGQHHYCIPRIFKPMPSWLFHNNGDGTFTDVSRASGIADHLGKAWGVVATDVNNDGRLDLFVANDTVANFLFMNRGNGHFDETGFEANIAYSQDGRARSGMGVDSADVDQDGWMDLFVANLDTEIFSLYRNNHDGTFDDVSIPVGIGMDTRWMSGWGLKFFDYDNDGNLDLMLVNGFPDDLVDKESHYVTYAEPLMLFHNDGKNFKNVSLQSGPVFSKTFAARGLAVGDFNNDGAQDVLINVNDAAPILLKNNAAKGNHWLGIQLVGRKANIDAIGARVTYQAADLQRSRMKVGAGSFLSSQDPRMVLGTGKHAKIDWVEVKWPQPSGLVERFTNLPIDRYVTLVEGTGKWK